ncbi:hypothetical protein [Humibacter sp. RRB41]|jgi:hypothetical protein|uniref:hypothetical protein n=1 Tax=Humibacter sp. RRB41 TaxID=2919946 RepID=UPI001FA9E6A2|nr:hypothetical protein [Humibacter sp. RRB41]
MYNDAYAAALNADRERLYVTLERERAQREILALRVVNAGEPVVHSARARSGGVRRTLRIAHVAG